MSVQSLKTKFEEDLKKTMEHRAKLEKELAASTQRALQLQGAIYAMEEAEKDDGKESSDPIPPSAA